MSSGARHPDEGVLLRLLDGELVEAGAREHASACPECRRTMDALARRSERLDDVLRSEDALIDEPAWDPDFLSTLTEGSGAPARRRPYRRVPAVRWAAAIVLLAALVSVSPVRAWMADGAEAVWAWITAGTDRRGAPEAADSGPVSTEVVASIAGPVLTVRLSGAVTPDSLVVRGTREARARALLRGGAGEGELLVRADGFEVRASGPGETVEVWTPPTVAEVRVTREGNELARRPRGEDPGWSWRLALPGSDSGPEPDPGTGPDPGPEAHRGAEADPCPRADPRPTARPPGLSRASPPGLTPPEAPPSDPPVRLSSPAGTPRAPRRPPGSPPSRRR